MQYKQWLFAEETVIFQTAQGSVYKFHNQRSVRFKVKHQFHDPADTGFKQESNLTVFVDPEFAREIGMWNSSSAGKKRLVLADNRVFLLSMNPSLQKHGLDKIIHNPSYVLEPEVGKSPLELWDRDTTAWPWAKPGMAVFAGNHPGSPVTQIGGLGFPVQDGI